MTHQTPEAAKGCRPLCIELFAGCFGWSQGWLSEGLQAIGFDIEHLPHHGAVPEGAELVLQDVLTLHGSQLKNASLILCSPPCTEYSYMAMPWSRAKQIAAALRGQGEFPESYTGSRTIEQLNALFNACFRIQREASEVAGHHIPMIVENVRGAQPWVGRAPWNYGSFYLWGDVPAIMPIVRKRSVMKSGVTHRADGSTNFHGTDGIKQLHSRGDNQTCGKFRMGLGDGIKAPGNDTFAKTGLPCGKLTDPRYPCEGRKVPMNFHEHAKTGKPGRSFQSVAVAEGTKGFVTGLGRGHDWRQDPSGRFNSKSTARKAASAQIAKIPFELSSYIARVFRPRPA